MALELNIESKYDGQIVPAFHVIDTVNVNFAENQAQVFGRVFSSQAAFQAGRVPLDNFLSVFYDLKALLLTNPSLIEKDSYGWLKTLAKFTGAVEKDATVTPVVPVDPVDPVVPVDPGGDVLPG